MVTVLTSVRRRAEGPIAAYLQPIHGSWKATTPLAVRTAAGAKQAALDEWVCSRDDEPPAWVSGRLWSVVQRRVAAGAEPLRCIGAAKYTALVTTMLEQAWQEAWGEPARPSVVESVVCMALDLICEGFLPARVVEAALRCAAAGNQYLLTAYVDVVGLNAAERRAAMTPEERAAHDAEYASRRAETHRQLEVVLGPAAHAGTAPTG